MLRRYADRAELDPGRLAEVEGQIESVLGVARKLRVRPEALPELLARTRQRLDEIGESTDIAALERRVAKARGDYETRRAPCQLRVPRPRLGWQRMSVTSCVNWRSAAACSKSRCCRSKAAAYGFEQAEYRIAGVAGDEARALAKVASGGELSRISLAIQVVTSRSASVPTLVFDEVDVGIGGGVAEVVGRLLAELGRDRQVLCVTHLPQVASRAGWQWQVSKGREGATRPAASLPSMPTDGSKIARMLGGVEITAITRQHAREMLAAG